MTRRVTRPAGRRAGTARRLVATLLALAAALATGWVAMVPAVARVAPGDVTLQVVDVAPNSPQVSHTPRPLALTLQLTNHTGTRLAGITVSVARSDPIASQSALDAAIARTELPSPSLVAPLAKTLKVTLPPYATRTVVYRTATDVVLDTPICLCADRIYPLYVTADYQDPAGAVTELAATQTFVPAFTSPPAKERVSWVWPLLDRPHRMVSATTFADDQLAAEVAPGGRLDKALAVVERVADTVPVTLLTDPELIDELAVMSRPAGYRVQQGSSIGPGTGGADAASWLARLRTVLADPASKLELAFTAPADPSVEALQRAGLAWHGYADQTLVGTAERDRIAAALGTSVRPRTDIAWPYGGTVGPAAMRALAKHGARTVVVNDRTFAGGATDGLAVVHTGAGRVTAAITSGALDGWAARVLTARSNGLALLPDLVAQLAIRVVTSMSDPHLVVLTPPRTLDVGDVSVAVRTIEETASSTWSTPLSLHAASTTVAAADRGPPRARGAVPQVASAAGASLEYVEHSLARLPGLWGTTPQDRALAAQRLAPYPMAVQRCESAELLALRLSGILYANAVESQIRYGIRGRVYLVPLPAHASYTLSSKNSQLPVTVENKLPDTVHVRITVSTASPGSGFSATELDVQIGPNSRKQVHVPTKVDRVGRFDVRLALSTPDGLVLGNPVPLTVRSTALGTIGVVITIAAAVVLFAAVTLRLARRLARLRRTPPQQQPPVPVGAQRR